MTGDQKLSASPHIHIQSFTLSAMHHRNYRFLSLGTIAMYSGVWIQTVAQGWLVLQLTNSALFLGIVSFSQAITNLAFGPFGGVIIDRVNKRRLLTAVAASYFLLLTSLATLTVLGLIQVWHIIIISLIYGLLLAFNQPAVQALIPTLVDREDLTNAVASNNSTWNAASVIGPAVAAFLVDKIGLGGCFYVTAAGYLVMVVALSSIRTQTAAVPVYRDTTVMKDLKQGLSYIAKDRAVVTLILMSAIPNLFGLPFLVVMPVFARDLLSVDASGLGWLTAAFGIGAFAGSAILTLLSSIRRKGWLLIAASCAFGLLLIVFSTTRSSWLALLFLAGIGLSYGLTLALTNSLLQTITSAEVKGRVMSIYALTWTLMPAGGLLIGTAASFFGVPVAIAIGGAITALFVAAIAVIVPALRALD